LKKVLILVLALIIVLSSIAMIGASVPDDSNEKLHDLTLPKTWKDINISDVNGSSSLSAFSKDHSLEFGVDFDTDINPNTLNTVGRGQVYQNGNALLEVVKIDGTEYHVFVKCNGTNNISSQPDMLDEADYELFKFNKLNSCSSAKLI
jgi:hypothetical protein